MDLFSKFYIQGRRAPDFRPLSLDLFGLQMKQSRCLRKVRLSVLSLSQEDASALKIGLENSTAKPGNPHLEYFSLSNIHFQKNSLNEICVGFRNNQSLEAVALVCCGLEECGKDTPTCLPIFLKLCMLKTKPNGSLGISTGRANHCEH